MANESELPNLGRRPIAAVARLAVCLAALLWTDGSFAQTFVSGGPAPRFGPVYGSQSADAAPNGPEAGRFKRSCRTRLSERTRYLRRRPTAASGSRMMRVEAGRR